MGGLLAGRAVVEALQSDQFWAARLPPSRKGTKWDQILQVLVAYRLIAPGSEWKLHRDWLGKSAMADLLGADFGLAEAHKLYACHGHCHGNRLAAMAGAGETGGMKSPPDPHYRHRFPAEIISHAVWLYHVFSLSLRDVELLLAERGIVVSYETVRRWCKKFGESFADCLRRRRPRPGTSGTSTRCSSGSRAFSIISGVPWIRTASCSISWSRSGVMGKPPSDSSGGC